MWLWADSGLVNKLPNLGNFRLKAIWASGALTGPVDLHHLLSPTTDEKQKYMATVSYASLVGSLIYAMICTRLDLAHQYG